MFLGCTFRFEPRANSRAVATVGSVMTIGLSINRMRIVNDALKLKKKKQFDKRKQDRLVQRFGLQQPQRLDVIQLEPPFPLLDQGDRYAVHIHLRFHSLPQFISPLSVL